MQGAITAALAHLGRIRELAELHEQIRMLRHDLVVKAAPGRHPGRIPPVRRKAAVNSAPEDMHIDALISRKGRR